MGKYFGTDGFRGEAGITLTSDHAYKVGRFLGWYYTDIPLLIIHGDEDMKAPLSMAYKLYDSCNGEKQLYIVHGADHSENYRKDPGGYEKIVTNFIEERLRQKKCQTPGTKL